MTIFCHSCGKEIPGDASDPEVCPSCLLRLGLSAEAREDDDGDPPRAASLVGRRLGHYEILEKLGEGGMGAAYRAEDTTLRRQVALKVLPADLANNAVPIERFQREAETLAALDHPNIVHIFSVEKADGVRFLTMQLVEGKPLLELIPDGGMPLSRVLELAIPIADALAAAHAKGIIHRDLKPGNVMVTDEGQLRVLDFGLAKAPGQALITGTGVRLGTPTYMSPEQVKGESVDQRSDLWSLGILLYEMMTGRPPFEGDTTEAVLHSVLLEEPEFSVAVVPPAVRPILRQALAKAPEDRYPSAKELLDDLRAVAAGHEPPAAPGATGGGVRPWRRWRLAAAGIAFGLVALFAAFDPGGLVERLRGGSPLAGISSLAVLPLDNFTDEQDKKYFADAMTGAMINSLAKLGGLRVISRASTMHYQDVDTPVHEIASELNVDALVEGFVLRDGDRVQISVQLIDGQSEKQLWGETYERDFAEVLTLLNEVASAIAGEIRLQLTIDQQARLAETRSVDPAAHEAYLRGIYYWTRRTPGSFTKALQEIERAIQLDPAFAPAHAVQAYCYNLLGSTQYSVLPTSEAIPKARAAALRALTLDPRSAEGHAALGYLQLIYDWDVRAAEESLERAIGLEPSYAPAHHWYGLLLSFTGRHEEALAAARRAQQLDPLSPIRYNAIGNRHFYARQYDLAAEQYEEALELDPRFPMAHFFLGRAHLEESRLDQAIASFHRARELSAGSPLVTGFLGLAYASAGDEETARGLLAELEAQSRQRYVPRFAFAIIHLGLGEADEMLNYLRQTKEENSGFVLYLGMDPLTDPFRSDPRFVELLQEISWVGTNPETSQASLED
jgi:serine/threonine-protein kinase